MRTRTIVLSLLVMGLMLTACSQPEQPLVAETPQEAAATLVETELPPDGETDTAVPEANGAEAPGEMIAGTVTVENISLAAREGAYDVSVSGFLPDGCTEVSAVSQSVTGSAIEIAVETERPADLMCTEAIVPFTEKVSLDTSGLAPGSYTVMANGVSAGQEIFVGEAGQGEMVPVSDEEQIMDTVWQWTSAVEPDQNVTEVPNPGSYTITLLEDGQATVKADCNQLMVSYTVDGHSLVFNMLGPSTLAFCGEQSVDNRFLSLLGSVNTWSLEEEQLILNTTGGASLTFASAGRPAGALTISPEQISLDTQGLPYSWQPVDVPLQAYDASQPPGPQGLPEHIQILFGANDPAARQPSDPVMFLIPVESYQAMYAANGDQSVAETMKRIAELAYALPEPAPASRYPALPAAPYSPVAGFNDLTVQLGAGTPTDLSASKNGYRAVSRWAQDANPAANQNLFYAYQGFTNDGHYLVSFFYPVRTDTLPDAPDLSQEEWDSFYADPETAINESAAQLNQLSASDFEPDLATLDALVSSLQIEGMVTSGIANKEWQWVEFGPAAEELEEISDPELYSVTFDDAGSFIFIADCNRGAGAYTVDGGFAGQLALQAGPMTLAACPAESRADDFLHFLFAVDEFRLLPGGETLELLLPGGGGVLRLQQAGTADLELPEPEAGAASGTIIADVGANVRLGPGTDYPVLGVAPLGTTGTIIGVSQDEQWWAFDVPQSSSVMGWVLSSLVAAENVDSVPVIPAPVKPVPEPLPKPISPSATLQFSADPTTIDEGGCSDLTWSVENIQAVWVYAQGADYEQYPVTGSGSQPVCPETTTVYEMRILHTDGTVELRAVTVRARPSASLADTSWIVSTLYGQFPLPGASLKVYFGDSGTLSANGGCNTFSGTYSAGNGTIAIGPLAGTLMSCGEALDMQDQTFTSALEAARTYSIEGSQLTLFDSAALETARLIIAAR